MPRDVRAYLLDIIESCDAIVSALSRIDLDAYKANRLVRSAVEREFTIIGGAMLVLSPARSPPRWDTVDWTQTPTDDPENGEPAPEFEFDQTVSW